LVLVGQVMLLVLVLVALLVALPVQTMLLVQVVLLG
jgi:hypothetical protein